MSLTRSTLPQEFVDATSPIMLKAPQPEFPLARLVFMSIAQAELKKMAAAGLGMPGRGPDPQGAPVPDLLDLQLMLNDGVRAQAVVQPVDIEKKGTGHTLRFNRPILTGGGYTLASRRVAAAQTISTTPTDISIEQTSITVFRNVGPYGAAGTAPQPYAVDALDSQRSLHSLGELVALNLQFDRTKLVDTVMASELLLGANTVRPGGATSDAAAFVANGDAPMDLNTIYRAEEQLNTLNVPRFGNGKYMAFLSAQQERQLREDPSYWKQRVFDPQNNPLRASYIAEIAGVELYRSNNLVTDAATVSGVTIHQGMMFGPGAVGWGVAKAPFVASAAEDNYGELSKFVWICYEGCGALDNTFVVNLRTD